MGRGWRGTGEQSQDLRALAKRTRFVLPSGMSMDPHALRPLGSTAPPVFPIALGCMGMSGMYGPTDERESIATIHPALDQGVTLLDTGDFYGTGHNEMLIGRAVRDRRDKALL